MNKIKVLTVVYWIMFAVAIWAFYVSLRSKTQQLEYSLIALGVWAAAYGVHYYLKRLKNH
ncbi:MULTISPECIES: hypothetical protein [Reichenbachiella]|uniref:Uncharacterized protein n=1 Tax=Reichenbachiella agariperforans TaxID=156994 RepID=A0A1M6SQ72_REIAG|nr:MULTISPECIES: hypothetical protein [Reichenbachiella]MBU2916223.1 hypothetical protein [Reichenbachiella agariperforans]RJE75075.1 hypothetical protein BGP76_18355 [Reichenbachiella sp. MSK19-1]SHK46787.1 hypothetical protein SAMN04488028_105104 [Reichenbachiella agariperforans]